MILQNFCFSCIKTKRWLWLSHSSVAIFPAIVQVYDYIDIHVPMRDVMYKRRLRGYASVGYKIQQNDSFTRQLSDKDKILLNGVKVSVKEKLSLHTAIIDKFIVWYGSVNYLGYNPLCTMTL